jgi:hypothetical protein
MAHFGLVRGQTSPYGLPRMGVARKSVAVDFPKYLDGVAYYQHQLEKVIHPNRLVKGMAGRPGDSVTPQTSDDLS